MKATIATQLGQQLHLTPQLLQSIRLLQLDSLQLELEVKRAIELNPLLELEEEPQISLEDAVALGNSQVEVAAFDELPDTMSWDLANGSWNGEDDRLYSLAESDGFDPQVRALQQFSLEMNAQDLNIVAFWLEHIDDSGYLTEAPEMLANLAAQHFGITAIYAEEIRQRILYGEIAGLASANLQECLSVQLRALPGNVPARPLALRILETAMVWLASHDYSMLAKVLNTDIADLEEAVGLILSLQPRPGQIQEPIDSQYIVPDVVTWYADGQWRVALNPATTPKVSIVPGYEQALERQLGEKEPVVVVNEGEPPAPSTGVTKMRELLNEARWLTRSLSMRYDTLLRTTLAIVAHQTGFLFHGDEALSPLTLKEVAEQIGMHESTISRITNGKYLQTPRGTFELKFFFAVRLEGASVSGQAVRAMVRRLIESEPAHRPLADEAIAGLLARQGIHIARRTVAKYREQLDIAPARSRKRTKAAEPA